MVNYFSLINGEFKNSISVLDRGLSYGDGIFETMSWCHLSENNLLGVEFWNRHIERIKNSCLITKIKFPSVNLLNNYKKKILQRSYNEGFKTGILKIIITRGVGGRGYKFERDIKPTIIFLSFPKADTAKSLYNKGVNVRFCRSPIFKNFQLAGLKHLNRLDSVMSRSEWTSEDFFEGVLIDDKKNIVEGTMTNIFFSKDKVLFTPEIKDFGIKGIMRQIVIEKSILQFEKVVEKNIKKSDVDNFDEMFLTNSLLKIIPVKKLEKKFFRISECTKNLIKYFDDNKQKLRNLELL